ncbi:MAG: hypothetical protein ACFFD7_16960, partial [Candidatus Thorarchaeota archaeon]
MNMKATFHNDIGKFYDHVFPYLIRNELENSLPLSILKSLKTNIHRYGKESPILFSLTKDKSIKLVSLMTPPFDIIISYTEDLDSIEILVEELTKREVFLPGVLSFKEAANKFTKLWCEKNSLESKLLRRERIYKLTEVSEETLGNKNFSVATKSYQSIVLEWSRKFAAEALSETTEEQLQRTISN